MGYIYIIVKQSNHQTKQSTLSNKAINIALQCIALCPLENKALPGTLGNFSHFPLLGRIRTVNEATNETLTDVKKRLVAFQRCLKFQKIPNSPGVMTARSCAPPTPQITLNNSFS